MTFSLNMWMNWVGLFLVTCKKIYIFIFVEYFQHVTMLWRSNCVMKLNIVLFKLFCFVFNILNIDMLVFGIICDTIRHEALALDLSKSDIDILTFSSLTYWVIFRTADPNKTRPWIMIENMILYGWHLLAFSDTIHHVLLILCLPFTYISFIYRSIGVGQSNCISGHLNNISLNTRLYYFALRSHNETVCNWVHCCAMKWWEISSNCVTDLVVCVFFHNCAVGSCVITDTSVFVIKILYTVECLACQLLRYPLHSVRYLYFCCCITQTLCLLRIQYILYILHITQFVLCVMATI